METKYIAYCNSTLSAVAVITINRWNVELACNVLAGFLIQDTIHVVLNREMYKTNYINFILHHILTIGIIVSPYPALYPEIATRLLQMETTVSFGNMIWFSKYHKLCQFYQNMARMLFFISYTYYRVYLFTMIVFTLYSLQYPLPLQLCIYGVYIININWYKTIVRTAISAA